MNAEHPSFTVWKAALRQDCEYEGKLQAFHAMGDYTLRLFWERGVQPSVKGILSDARSDAGNDAAQETAL